MNAHKDRLETMAAVMWIDLGRTWAVLDPTNEEKAAFVGSHAGCVEFREGLLLRLEIQTGYRLGHGGYAIRRLCEATDAEAAAIIACLESND